MTPAVDYLTCKCGERHEIKIVWRGDIPLGVVRCPALPEGKVYVLQIVDWRGEPLSATEIINLDGEGV